MIPSISIILCEGFHGCWGFPIGMCSTRFVRRLWRAPVVVVFVFWLPRPSRIQSLRNPQLPRPSLRNPQLPSFRQTLRSTSPEHFSKNWGGCAVGGTPQPNKLERLNNQTPAGCGPTKSTRGCNQHHTNWWCSGGWVQFLGCMNRNTDPAWISMGAVFPWLPAHSVGSVWAWEMRDEKRTNVVRGTQRFRPRVILDSIWHVWRQLWSLWGTGHKNQA